MSLTRLVFSVLVASSLAATPALAGGSKQAVAESVLDATGAEAEFDAGFRGSFVEGFVSGLTASGQVRVVPGREADLEALILEWWIPRMKPVTDRLFVQLRARSATHLVSLLSGGDLKKWAAFERTHPTPDLRSAWEATEPGKRVKLAQASLGLEMAGIAAQLSVEYQPEFAGIVAAVGPEFAVLIAAQGLVGAVP